MMTKEDLVKAIQEAILDIEAAEVELRQAGPEWARAENEYRKAKATAFLVNCDAKMTVKEKEMRVDQVCERQRQDAHIAEAARETAKESLRARMAKLNGYQTIASLEKAEMQLIGGGTRQQV